MRPAMIFKKVLCTGATVHLEFRCSGSFKIPKGFLKNIRTMAVNLVSAGSRAEQLLCKRGLGPGDSRQVRLQEEDEHQGR